MAKRAGYVGWVEMDKRHRDKVQRKYEKIETLKALVEMWESDPDAHEYVVELRARLRTAVANLEAMKPLKDE